MNNLDHQLEAIRKEYNQRFMEYLKKRDTIEISIKIGENKSQKDIPQHYHDRYNKIKFNRRPDI